ncbi:serine/threonine-protein kinase [Saccharothrix variisporea]|uniref:non-specific serine/threonine protein kinase n=1 Tax=Saccharothrix variisporea TaxID=543527 RepID=A0A495XJX1_9PSEU|nr:serine/threonine-protein kinase [Saccharothrix variisporea]RKT73989.1 serine/threonine protein kinase [Saccharothrix variisporea]
MWDGDLTGEVVDGRYALGGLYGSGGMAEVYRAYDTELDRRVAIKVFQGTATLEDQIRLDREAQMLSELDCPGVVAVYGTGSYRGRPFYVMQAIDGGTLRRRMREALAPEVVARIGAQVAEILGHVHRHDVVHRDVKPSNILLATDERRAYLADFGLALQGQVTRVTRSGVLVGTAGYLAPEQVRGAEVGPPADVYALGLVLLECLTGRPEYPGGDTEAALARLHREPRIPSNLPAEWVEVLTAMTHTLPSKRPTATECAAMLAVAERASAGLRPLVGVEVAPRVAEQPPPPPTEPRRRRRTALLIGAAAALLGVVAMLHALTIGSRPDPADTRQQLDAPVDLTTTAGVVPPGATAGLDPSTVTVVESGKQVAGPPQDPKTVVVVTSVVLEPTSDKPKPTTTRDTANPEPPTETIRPHPTTPEPTVPTQDPKPRMGARG